MSLFDRRPVRIGGAVTALATAVALGATAAIPYETVQRGVFELIGVWLSGDGWGALRYLGGLIGGFAAGYLTGGRWEESLTNALAAVALGLVGLYVAYCAVASGVALTQGSAPPVGYLLLVVPLLVGAPFAAAFVLTAPVGGVAGLLARQYRDGTLLA
ncbi:hypothetical protein [Halosimplex amylolyticum]|uniref:hypothetical protein n=1 Tax=Halosimplex amylolyticum TaxID=3396616 RepID=UPI003F56D941